MNPAVCKQLKTRIMLVIVLFHLTELVTCFCARKPEAFFFSNSLQRVCVFAFCQCTKLTLKTVFIFKCARDDSQSHMLERCSSFCVLYSSSSDVSVFGISVCLCF